MKRRKTKKILKIIIKKKPYKAKRIKQDKHGRTLHNNMGNHMTGETYTLIKCAIVSNGQKLMTQGICSVSRLPDCRLPKCRHQKFDEHYIEAASRSTVPAARRTQDRRSKGQKSRHRQVGNPNG